MKNKKDINKNRKKKDENLAIGIGLGLSLGSAFGLIMENIGFFTPSIYVLEKLYVNSKKEKENKST